MTQNLDGTRFVIRANARKFHNSPPVRITLKGEVAWHDGRQNIYSALRSVVDFAEAECAQHGIITVIDITLITQAP